MVLQVRPAFCKTIAQLIAQLGACDLSWKAFSNRKNLVLGSIEELKEDIGLNLPKSGNCRSEERVKGSTTVNTRRVRPLAIRSCTKSVGKRSEDLHGRARDSIGPGV